MQLKHCIVAFNKASQSYQCLKGDKFTSKPGRGLTHIDQIHKKSKIARYSANALIYKMYIKSASHNSCEVTPF